MLTSYKKELDAMEAVVIKYMTHEDKNVREFVRIVLDWIKIKRTNND
jgi:hypothetical protein